MPYKDPEESTSGSWHIVASVANGGKPKREQQLRTSEPSKMETTIPPDSGSNQGRGWGLLLLFTGIAVGLPMLFARFGSGQKL